MVTKEATSDSGHYFDKCLWRALGELLCLTLQKFGKSLTVTNQKIIPLKKGFVFATLDTFYTRCNQVLIIICKKGCSLLRTHVEALAKRD